MGRFIKRAGWCLVVLAAMLSVAMALTTRSGDPSRYPVAAGQPNVEIFVVSHGYHSGIVVPRAALATMAIARKRGALIGIATRFYAYPWIEFGWGEEEFYRSVPTASSLSFGLAMRALVRPGNASVLHVVGLPAPPIVSFSQSDIVAVKLSQAGFEGLVDNVNATFATPNAAPDDLGRGLYGPSLFFRANGSFNIFHVCNHWVADVLDAAGVPTSPMLAVLPAGLLLDLRWRSGLVPLARSVD